MKTKPKIEFDLKQVEFLASRGLTMEEIAYALDVSAWTIYKNKRENKDFTDAIKKGKAKGKLKISNVVFDKAEKGEPWACKMYLNGPGGWGQTVHIDHTSSDGSMSPRMTAEQRALEFSRMMEEMDAREQSQI